MRLFNLPGGSSGYDREFEGCRCTAGKTTGRIQNTSLGQAPCPRERVAPARRIELLLPVRGSFTQGACSRTSAGIGESAGVHFHCIPPPFQAEGFQPQAMQREVKSPSPRGGLYSGDFRPLHDYSPVISLRLAAVHSPVLQGFPYSPTSV